MCTFQYSGNKQWITDSTPAVTLQALRKAGNKLCTQFLQNLEDVIASEKSDIINILQQTGIDILFLLRIKLYTKVIEGFPELENYDLITRKKKYLLCEDIYIFAESLVFVFLWCWYWLDDQHANTESSSWMSSTH